jgi:hypothetical protein
MKKTVTRECSRARVFRKPDAGNLHIRFDEGEGFIRKDAPSLLYRFFKK